MEISTVVEKLKATVATLPTDEGALLGALARDMATLHAAELRRAAVAAEAASNVLRAGPETEDRSGPETEDRSGPETEDRSGPETEDKSGPETEDKAGPETDEPPMAVEKPDLTESEG